MRLSISALSRQHRQHVHCAGVGVSVFKTTASPLRGGHFESRLAPYPRNGHAVGDAEMPRHATPPCARTCSTEEDSAGAERRVIVTEPPSKKTAESMRPSYLSMTRNVSVCAPAAICFEADCTFVYPVMPAGAPGWTGWFRMNWSLHVAYSTWAIRI